MTQANGAVQILGLISKRADPSFSGDIRGREPASYASVFKMMRFLDLAPSPMVRFLLAGSAGVRTFLSAPNLPGDAP
jgi:hypothetical protein